MHETELILGPMFAGKTTELMNRLKKHLVQDRKVVLFTHGDDNRYSREALASSHDGKRMQAIRVRSVSEMKIEDNEVTVVGIDEGQFFPDLAGFCLEQNQLGRLVIVAALNHIANPSRDVWPNVVPLLGFAFVTTITNVCVICRAPGLCSRRLTTTVGGGGGETSPPPVVDIGSDDKYIPTCSKCYKVEPVPVEVLQKRRDAVQYILKISH